MAKRKERPTWSLDSRRSPLSFRSRRWPGSESTPPLAPRAWLPLPPLAAGACQTQQRSSNMRVGPSEQPFGS